MGGLEWKVLVLSLSAEQYSGIDRVCSSQHSDILPPLVLSCSHSSEKHLHVDKICVYVHGWGMHLLSCLERRRGIMMDYYGKI